MMNRPCANDDRAELTFLHSLVGQTQSLVLALGNGAQV